MTVLLMVFDADTRFISEMSNPLRMIATLFQPKKDRDNWCENITILISSDLFEWDDTFLSESGVQITGDTNILFRMSQAWDEIFRRFGRCWSIGKKNSGRIQGKKDFGRLGTSGIKHMYALLIVIFIDGNVEESKSFGYMNNVKDNVVEIIRHLHNWICLAGHLSK